MQSSENTSASQNSFVSEYACVFVSVVVKLASLCLCLFSGHLFLSYLSTPLCQRAVALDVSCREFLLRAPKEPHISKLNTRPSINVCFRTVLIPFFTLAKASQVFTMGTQLQQVLVGTVLYINQYFGPLSEGNQNL